MDRLLKQAIVEIDFEPYPSHHVNLRTDEDIQTVKRWLLQDKAVMLPGI